MAYVKGSLTGTNLSEKSTADLNKPVFTLPNLKITESIDVQIDVKAACAMQTFLNKGGIPKADISAPYTGGTTNHQTLPFSIKQPSLSIFSVTNQFVVAAKGDIVIREIQLKNSGDGHLPTAEFYQTNQSGLKVLGVSGGNLKFSADTIFSSFDSSHFKLIGDKDIYWSKNEILKIHDTLFVDDCSKFQSKYSLSLDCFGNICKTTNQSANITLKNVAPVLQFIPTRKILTCYDPSTMHEQGLTIINTGTDTSRYTTINVFQSAGAGFYASILSAIDTSSITLQYGANGAVTSYHTNAIYNNNSTGFMACLGKGTIGGFDAIIPDIPPGDTVFMKWDSYTCCATTCNTAYYNFRWRFAGLYRDQCDNILKYAERWGSGGIYTGMRFTEFMPTDIRDGDTAKFNIVITQGTLYNSTVRSKTEIRFILPKGMTHSLSKSDFRFDAYNGAKWEPKTISKSGDTISAFFIGRPPFSLVRSDLNIKAIGDCSQSKANKNSNYKVEIDYNTDTACASHCVKRLYCYTGTIRTHCANQCAGGMKFTDFKNYRISYGLPDNDNNGLPDATGNLDMDKIATERVLYGDTLLTSFHGRVNRLGTITAWTRMTARSQFSYGRYLTVADARIRIFRSGNQLYSCPNLASSFTTSGNTRTFTFDLSTPALISASCPLYSGFQYFANDSIILEVKYLVSTNPGNFFRETSVTNDFYLHTVANPNSSQRYQCDTFGGKFMLAGSYFTNWGRNTYTNRGCNEISVAQNYYLSIGNCCANYGGGNLFPFEYRNWAKPHTIIAIPPKGYDFVHARWTDYRTAGTGQVQAQAKDTIVPNSSTSDTLVFPIEQYFKDKSGTFDLSDDGFHGNFTLKLKPNCEAESTGQVRYGFVFDLKNYFGSGLDTVFTTTQNDIISYSAPNLKLTPLATDVVSNSDTVEWQIRLENTSNDASASNVWIGASDNGNTTLAQIYDIDLKTNVPISNDYFTLGDILPNQSKNYLIRAVYQQCGRDSFDLLMGYNCRSYPDSADAAQCQPYKVKFRYEPLNTRIESSISPIDTAIDLCKDIPQTVTVSNKGNSKAFDLYFDLFLRKGMTLKDTAWLFIPGQSDSTPITNPVDLGQNTYRWEVSKQSKFLDSLGLESVTSPKVNSFKLKYYLVTDCDFTSSIYYLARPGAKLKCGDPVNSGYSFSKPIDVKGVKKPYFSSIKLNMGVLDVCKYDGKGSILFLNLGPDTTGTQDFIHLTLPNGIYLDTSFLKGSSNTPPAKPTFSDQIGQWIIPSGIQPGDSMLFEFNTTVNGYELACGSSQILLNSVVTQPALCVSENKYCDIKVSTASDIKLDSIKKAVFVLTAGSAQALPNGSMEDVQLNYTIQNTGTTKDSGVLLEVKFVDDKNSNGVVDAGEPVVYIDTIYSQLDATTVFRNVNMTVDPVSSCRLLLVIDSTNCVCSPTLLPFPPISVKNAGKDTTVCSRTDVVVGFAPTAGFSYSWSPTGNIADSDSSTTIFNGINANTTDATYRLILETDKGACKIEDTVVITLHPAIFLDLKDEEHICEGERIVIGDLVSGGTGFKNYQWSPTDSLQYPTLVKTWAYPSVTTTYKMTVTDMLNCKYEDSTKVIVHPKPIADFSFKDTCEDELYFFTNLSQKKDIGFDSIHWKIGIEETQDFNPIIQIDSSYQIPVSLLVRDSFGCMDSTQAFLNPFPRPVAGFTSGTVCELDTILLTNTSTLTAGTFFNSWTSTQGSSSSTDLNIKFPQYGNEKVRLKVTSDKGCADSIEQQVQVFEKPDVSISLDSVCQGESTNFELLSSFSTSDTIDNVVWDLGDGQSSINDKFKHKYAVDSLYSISVIARSNNKCFDTAYSSARVYQKPEAALTVNIVCLGDSLLALNQTIENKFTTTRIFWDDGPGYQSGSDSFKFLKAAIGLHPVSLIIESENACRDTAQSSGTVLHLENLSLNQIGNCENENITLNFSPAFIDSIQNVSWTWSGVRSGLSVSEQYLFGTVGPHTVNLQVDMNNGCSTNKDFTITLDPKPVSDFTFDLFCQDNQVEFTDNSSTPSGSITSLSWDLDDGNLSTANNFNHTYASLGSYDVQLITENSFACKDTSQKTIQIDNIVLPDFSIDNICANDTQQVRDLSTGMAVPITSYEFDMGDGNTMTNNPFDYVYLIGGTYSITLTIQTLPGCTYSTTKTITVYDAPIPGFSTDQEFLDLVNNKITVTDESTGGTTYEYTISDGSIYSSADFSHGFTDTGVFTIRQKVTDAFGCFGITEKQIPVYMITHILIPNAFHPDGDGLNETFEPEGLGIITYELEIFDRWGGMVYQTEDSKAWTGADYPTGIYAYRVRIRDHKGRFHTYTGTVHLLR